MQPKEINRLLADRVDQVCQKLFPAGKTVGSNYEVGNIAGDAGQSLKIPLAGSNLGMYSDFETGTNGDLISLWGECKGQTFKEAITDIKDYLSIKDDFSANLKKIAPSNRKPKIIKSFPDTMELSGNPMWCKFLDKRKINPSTAEKLNVSVLNGKLFFPHYFENKPVMWHTRDYKRDSNGKFIQKDGKYKKDFQTNANPQYCLWGWQGIKDSDRNVIITEGRIDALSYISQGIPALSVPSGGGKGGKQSWIDFEYHNLIDHFDRIYLSMDKDSAGQDALQEIISRLGDHICWIVELPNGYKDANEAHVAGEDFREILKKAKQNTPEGLHRGGEFVDDVMEYFYPSEDLKNKMVLPWINGKGYESREGEVTIIAGENGSGKTQIIGNIMLGGFLQGKQFGIASMEMSPKMLLGRLTRQATGLNLPTKEYIQTVSNFLNDWMWVYQKKGIVDKSLILKSFLYLNKRYGVKYFIIDSLAKCGINEDDYNGQKNFIDELEAFADDNQCHIFLIHHIRKKDSKQFDKPPSKSDVKGTGALIDMVDNLLMIWRNRPKEDFLDNPKEDFEDDEKRKKYMKKKEIMEKKSDALLIVAKQRNGDWEGKIPLWFNKSCYQYLDSSESLPCKFVRFSNR